jgi:phosphoglycolate phosphatase
MRHGRIGNNIKAFLFDLDGTLVDSANQIYEAVDLARVELKYAAAPEKFIYSKIGLPAKDLFADLDLTESELSNAVTLFRFHLSNIKLSENDLYGGVPEILQMLAEKGIKLGVATNKPTALAIQSLSDSGIHDYFDFIVGADNSPPKPDPAIVLKCLELMSINQHEAVMIGDRIEDVHAAKAAKVLAIGIAQGPHSEEYLLTNGADITFSSMKLFYHKINEGEVIANI